MTDQDVEPAAASGAIQLNFTLGKLFFGTALIAMLLCGWKLGPKSAMSAVPHLTFTDLMYLLPLALVLTHGGWRVVPIVLAVAAIGTVVVIGMTWFDIELSRKDTFLARFHAFTDKTTAVATMAGALYLNTDPRAKRRLWLTVAAGIQLLAALELGAHLNWMVHYLLFVYR